MEPCQLVDIPLGLICEEMLYISVQASLLIYLYLCIAIFKDFDQATSRHKTLRKYYIPKIYSLCRDIVLFALFGLLPLSNSSPVQQHDTRRLPWERTKSTGFGTLTTTSSNNGTILRVLMDNPPTNLYDYKLITDLYDLLSSAVPGNITVSIPPPKVMIFSSADPDFWMSHYDGTLFGTNPPFNESYTEELFTKNRAIVGMLKSLPTILIGEINGRATGSGNEFLVQCDMDFSGLNTILGAPEVAAEYMLTSSGIDALTAAEIGWVNRMYRSETKLRRAVDEIAGRIALFPAAGLNGTKAMTRGFSAPPSTVEADIATLEADIDTVEADTAIAEADTAIAEADTAAVEADIVTVEADIATIFRLEAGEKAPDVEYLRISKNQSRQFELGVPHNMIEIWE